MSPTRQRLLDAASEGFAEGGSATGMAAIAARAGVGVATLYRRFGDRAGLVAAVYEEMTAQLVDAADRLAAEEPPLRAVEVWLTVYARQLVAKRAMAAELEPILAARPLLLERSRARVAAALQPLLRSAQQQGIVQEQVRPIDVVHLLGGLSAPTAEPPDPEVVLQIVLRGIRTDPGGHPSSPSPDPRA